MTPPTFTMHAPTDALLQDRTNITSARGDSGTVANEWVLSFADVATNGADLTLIESYPTYESAAAAFLLNHVLAFAHPVQITAVAPGRWLLKHLDGREQPVDLVRIDGTIRSVGGSCDA